MISVSRIYVVACLHGNETFGLKILSRLDELNNHDIKTRVANPAAVAKRRRFIDYDLNRSFGANLKSGAEFRLASTIMRDISDFSPDLVIDIHTSTTNVGKVAIVAENTAFTHSISLALDMERLAVMPNEVMAKSLVGQHPNKSVALEFGYNLRSDTLASDISKRIIGLIVNSKLPSAAAPIDTYKVLRSVSKPEMQGVTYANFVFNKKLHGYPFLMGEKNYSDIAGFLAKKINPTTL